MSAFGKISARTSQSPFLACALTAFLAGASPLAAAPTVSTSSVALAAGETWRGAGGAPGEAKTFSIRLDAPGILMVDVDAPVAAPAVRVALLQSEAAGGAGAELLRQSATSLALAVAPGNYRLRVAAEDPRMPLSPLRLRTRFTAAALGKSETGTEIEIDPDPLRSETGTEIEIDPDPNKSETGTEIEIDPDPNKSETGTEIEIDPDPNKSETGTEIEIDPDPLKRTTGSSSLRLLERRLGQLCRQGEIDDHGDTFSCSTPLAPGTAARGALGNSYGDDSDVFRFEVSALTTVELNARAPFPLAGELYDRHGQRLDSTVAEDAGGMRLVRTLVPGTYFLRLEGWEGAEGDYTLAVRLPLR